MDKRSNDNFRSEIEWTLFIPKREKISFRFSVFTNGNPENSGDSENDYGIELLGILQEVFYVTCLESIHYDKESDISNNELDERDNNWDIFRWLWYGFVNVLHDNADKIILFPNMEETKFLSKKKGKGYKQYVKRMGPTFEARYNLYTFSLLFWSKKFILKNFGSCTDIICNHPKFIRFWNGVINFLSESVRNLQKDDVKSLNLKFQKILNNPDTEAEYKKFNKKYLGKNGCFSLTIVDKKNGLRQNVLCFSGLRDYSEDTVIGKAIKKIKEDGGFQNPYIVKVTDKIRYELICGLNITYGEAKECDFFSKNRKYNRMFTCCERKTIADYNWDDCTSYTMIVKYAPCELCKEPIKIHNDLYAGKVLHGKASNPLEPIGEFDRLAKCISSSSCPWCKYNSHIAKTHL